MAMSKTEVTWGAIGSVLGVLASAVGGSWYVSSAISAQAERAREIAENLVQEHQERVEDVYARREDLRVLETKIDAVLELQGEILVQIRARPSP